MKHFLFFPFKKKHLLFSSKTERKAEELKALSEASEHLYSQPNPYAPYRIINNLIRQCIISLGWELFIFVSLKHKNALKHVIRQSLITSSTHLVERVILLNHKPNLKLFFYLPKKCLDVLKRGGIQVDYIQSLLRFQLVVISKFKDGFKFFLLLLKNSDGVPVLKNPFCSIHGIPIDAIPRSGSYTFLHWLEQESTYKNKFNSYRMNISQKYNHVINFKKSINISLNVFPELLTSYSKFLFIIKSLFYFLLSGILLPFGRWQLAFLAKEIILYHYFLLLEPNQKAACYMFFDTLGFRPLWTYQAELENIDVINVFYASSYTLFHYNNEVVPKDIKLPYVQIASWPRYFVQGEEFRQSLLSIFENQAEINVVGPFPFVDQGEPIPVLEERDVLVFDVDPSSNYLEYTKHGYIIPYLTDEIVCRFWQDLYQLAKELKLRLVHKRKRADPLLEDSSYKKLLKKMELEEVHYKRFSEISGIFNVLKENPNTLLVNLPFTSTGELSKLLGLRSIYYDPLKSISSSEIHARGAKVISGIDNLKEWLSNNISRY